MTTAGPLLKEEFDSRVGSAISMRNTTYSWFRKRVSIDNDINTRGYFFSLKTQRNQGYGSLTSAQEGGLLPIAGAPARRKVQIDYRDHFISGELSGRVMDAPSKTALLDLSKDAMADAEESFTTFQDLYLFGNGNGVIGVASGAVSGATVPFVLSQTNPYGSMMLQPGQRIQLFDTTLATQRVNGGTTTFTVVSKDVNDIVTFDVGPLLVVTGDVAVIENTLNRETLGLDFFVGNAGTNWLNDGLTGSPIARAGNPWTSATVIDKTGSALAPDFIDTIALQTSNQQGDGKPNWDQVLLSHPAQQNMYRKLGYALTRVVDASGNPKLDLGFANVSHNGMEWRVSSHCPADRLFGLQLSSWALKENKAPQMYNFQNGPLIQKPGTAQYYDAAQFAVYARYALVCKEPFNQFLLKGLQFNVADVRRNLN
jgi:hypothetical protein